MRSEGKAVRQQQIETAAYAVLEEKGYAGASMLAIARKAKASNETLYNWYGDKRGLFKALVARNAGEVRARLTDQIAAGGDAIETLREVGPMLLAVLTSARAVALNRAAAADATGDLGAAIASEGRDAVLPLISLVLSQACGQGQLRDEGLSELTEVYLSLLIGDLQIRCVIGRMHAPDPEACRARSDRALALLQRLYGTDADLG